MTGCLEHCEACSVPAGLPCYCDAAICARAARPGQEAFRAKLAKHAEARAKAPTPDLLTPEQLARQREAESCIHRDCVGCGCNGCRCRPGGRRPGQVVSILECLACVDEATSRPAS